MPDVGGGYQMNPQRAQAAADQRGMEDDSQRSDPEYPPDHVAAMRVPKGGSSCASCKYLGSDGGSCTSEYFTAWNGSDKLPAPADEFCSDWYEPKQQQQPAKAGTAPSDMAGAAAAEASPPQGM